VVAIYSTFLQRGFDQVVHDVCIENLDVVFAIDRAGLVGGDGATHQGIYDMSYLRALPNMSVAMPRDASEMRRMLKKALELGGPKAVRWPRGSTEQVSDVEASSWEDIEWGSWEVLKQGTRAYILAVGPTVDYALEAIGSDPAVGVVNARFIKPLDTDTLLAIADRSELLVTVEDHAVAGGFGSAVLEALAEHDVHIRVERLGIPDVPVPHGSPLEQHESFGFGPNALRRKLREFGMMQRGALAEASD
jgi:1-deoxy-D-xylulose-5-phosphate synthase